MHLLFWIILFLIRFYLSHITFNVYSGFPVESLLVINFLSTGIIAGCYYMVVGPAWKILRQQKYFSFIMFLIGIFVLYTLFDAIAEQIVLHQCKPCLAILAEDQPAYYSLLQSGLVNIMLKRLLSLGTPLGLMLFLAFPLCIKISLQGAREHIKALELQKENVELEFNFLKAQLNPHFLFNTMNNIYGLIMQGGKEKPAGLVARLSELLRYILYESNETYMPIDKEIKLLQDYVELEKVRLNQTEVQFDVRYDASANKIAPLLLIPIIENAFKYCSDEAGAFIYISIDVKEATLQFKIDNSIDPKRQQGSKGGIGLTNFHKRLELYYPDQYHYEIMNVNGVYTVNLSLSLI